MSGTPEVILNVDDNEAVRYARTRVLQRAGYSVDEAKGGEEAWTKICAAPPHLVILDVRLPDVSGFTICRACGNAQSRRACRRNGTDETLRVAWCPDQQRARRLLQQLDMNGNNHRRFFRVCAGSHPNWRL